MAGILGGMGGMNGGGGGRNPEDELYGILGNMGQNNLSQALIQLGAGIAGGADKSWGAGIGAGLQGAGNALGQGQGDRVGILNALMKRNVPLQPTAAMQNLQASGLQPGSPEYSQALRAYVTKPQTAIDMRQESEYEKNVGKLLAEEFVKGQTSGATANNDLANLSVMRTALDDPNLYTGTGGQTIQAFKKGAQSLFGVPVKGVSSGEIMQNLASEIAVGNRAKLPGPMSDSDRQFLVDMAPNLSKSPEGNRLLIELGMAHKRWEIGRASAARDYAGKNQGRLDPGFYEFAAQGDSQAQQEFEQILGRLRGMGEAPARSPGVGLPEGWSIKRLD